MGKNALETGVMNRYRITVMMPSKDQTFSSVVVSICPGSVKVSCPKESGVEFIPVPRGSRHEFFLRLPDGENIHLCLGTKGTRLFFGGIQISEISNKNKEGYLM